MPSTESDKTGKKSKKPSNSAFKQQKFPAWQPTITARTVFPAFFIIGLAFIPIGVGLLLSSNQVQEYQVEYTYCNSSSNRSVSCDNLLANGDKNCTCEIFFNITTQFKKNVFIYYGLTNFYQNHKLYVKSKDDFQLLGDLTKPPSTDCRPYDINGNISIAPCGAIANSLFNDKISLFLWLNKEMKRVPLENHGIAWPTDKRVKFRNPKGKTLEKAFNHTTKPINWTVNVWELDPDDEKNNGFENEDLIVWMRTAAFPTFRKLYRRVNHDAEPFRSGIPGGMYSLRIKYRYRVTPFKGTKRIIISNTSWLGGKNPKPGIAYIVVGSVCLFLAVMFVIIDLKSRVKVLTVSDVVE